MERSKVKPRSHHDIAHLHLLANVPTKYKLPTPYGFVDIPQKTFCRSRSLRQGQTRGSHAKKKIMFLHSKNKASRKGYKGEC